MYANLCFLKPQIISQVLSKTNTNTYLSQVKEGSSLNSQVWTFFLTWHHSSAFPKREDVLKTRM